MDSIKSEFTHIIYPRSYLKTVQQQQAHLAFHHPSKGLDSSKLEHTWFNTLFTPSSFIFYLRLLPFHTCLLLIFKLFFFFICSLSVTLLHHLSPYNCLFSLPFWSEPSHLLNHLVKFVSSGNLLRVLTIIAKSKILKKEQPIKCAILKSTNLMW